MAHAHTAIQYIYMYRFWLIILTTNGCLLSLCAYLIAGGIGARGKEREKKFLTKNNEKEMRDWGEKVFRTNGNPAALQT